MGYKTCRYLNDKIRFTCLFWEDFYHFTYIPFFSLRLYLVLAESNVKNSSSHNDLHCGL